MANEPGAQLTWNPPVGEEFVVSPSLAELESAILHRGAEYWLQGSCDGGLHYDVDSISVSQLILMFAAPNLFCVLYSDSQENLEQVAFDSEVTAGSELLVVSPGGNPQRLPRHYFVSRQTAWQAVQDFCQEGQRSPKVTWAPFQPPDLSEENTKC